MSFSPDLIIIKNRTSSSTTALWQDSIRGATKYLRVIPSSEVTTAFNVDSFDPSGFTVTGNVNLTNETGEEYVLGVGLQVLDHQHRIPGIQSTLKSNPITGFSVVSYTGNGQSNSSFGHGQIVSPKLVIIKNRTNAADWALWHDSYLSNQYSRFNTINNVYTDSNVFKSNAVSSSVVSIGNDSRVNASTNKYIAYCWSEVEGYSKIGSYQGTGEPDNGPFVYTGFRPRWIMIHNKSDWYIWDSEGQQTWQLYA